MTAPTTSFPIRLNALLFAAHYGLNTIASGLNPIPTTVRKSEATPSEASNSTRGMATSVQRRQARSGRSSLLMVNLYRLQPSSECTPTYPVLKPTTTTQTIPRTAVTSATCCGVASQHYRGAEINSENLANSKAKNQDPEEQVQARMDSLMMVIMTLCDCIGAVDESNAPNQYEVKMKIVDKISDLIDKIEY